MKIAAAILFYDCLITNIIFGIKNYSIFHYNMNYDSIVSKDYVFSILKNRYIEDWNDYNLSYDDTTTNNNDNIYDNNSINNNNDKKNVNLLTEALENIKLKKELINRKTEN